MDMPPHPFIYGMMIGVVIWAMLAAIGWLAVGHP